LAWGTRAKEGGDRERKETREGKRKGKGMRRERVKGKERDGSGVNTYKIQQGMSFEIDLIRNINNSNNNLHKHE
jgi:hypothetical protein